MFAIGVVVAVATLMFIFEMIFFLLLCMLLSTYIRGCLSKCLAFFSGFLSFFYFCRCAFFSHQDVNVNLMEATADDGSFKTDRCSLECLTIRRTLSFDELTTWFIY